METLRKRTPWDTILWPMLDHLAIGLGAEPGRAAVR